MRKNVVITVTTTTTTKLFPRKKIQQNKGAHLKNKALTPWSTRLGLQENSNHKSALCTGVPDHSPWWITSQLSKARRLPLLEDSSAPPCGQHHKGRSGGEPGVAVMSAWVGFLQLNHRPAKGHITTQQAPKRGNTQRKHTVQQLIEL